MLLSLKVFFYPLVYYAKQLAKKKDRGCFKNKQDLNFETMMNKPLVD